MPAMSSPSTLLPWTFDPLQALARWPSHQRPLLLHSGRHHPRWARCSILTHATDAYRFISTAPDAGQSQWLGHPDRCPVATWAHRPFRDLAALLADPQPLWVGYLSYDLARFLEKLPDLARADRHWPLIQLQRCPGWLIHDAAAGTWHACGTWASQGPPELADPPTPDPSFHATAPRSTFTRDAYERAVAQAIDYIAAGDIFQVNLAQRFTAEFRGSAKALFAQLAHHSPAWYGAYLDLTAAPGEPRRTIASTSPELFLEVDDRGQVITRPIKGTRPASVVPAELRDSEKDIAELNMIVDLLRNDLGRVCSYGSVKVQQARAIESHPTVHHGVATITGQLHERKTLVDLLRATLPGGSITGAPKVRAMQIIEELEPVRRGPYCGAIGYLQGSAACLNIAIRTLLLERDEAGVGRVDFSVGGGIVADSVAAAEYQETLDKAAALTAALQACRPTRV
jgi:para-aminobenzoate synthetase component 1